MMMLQLMILWSLILLHSCGGKLLNKEYFLWDRCEQLPLSSTFSSSFQSFSSSQEMQFHNELGDMLFINQYSACAACSFCESYVIGGQVELMAPAYIYASRALLMFPKLAPALSCISALYVRQKNWLRALFYAELAYHRNKSYVASYPDLGNTDHLFVALSSHVDSFTALRVVGQCAETIALIGDYDNLYDIFHEIHMQEKTLLSAYWEHLHLLEESMVGPAVSAYEAFLDYVEDALNVCKQGRHSRTPVSCFAPKSLHVYPKYIPSVRWPADKTLIILSYVQIGNVLKTFGENNIGLSDALNRLGVPHRVLSRSITDDDFITILNIGKIVGEEYSKYVFWNFEKNPSIQHNLTKTGKIDCKHDSCGNDIMRFGKELIYEAVSVWESVSLNMFKWPEDVGAEYVPSLLPDQIISMSKIQQQYTSKQHSISPAVTLRGLDSMRPIDILFFGSPNQHRIAIQKDFENLAASHDLRIEFYLTYDLFGLQREKAIQEAKVVLNLANFRWPFTVEDRPKPGPISSDGPVEVAEKCATATNFHRIRSLLAHGKVVLSERSGNTLEESLLSEVVTFVDTADLVSTALQLLKNPEKRFLLEKNSVAYMLEDHTQEYISTSSQSCGRASALKQLSAALSTLAVRAWGPSHLNSMSMPKVDNLSALTDMHIHALEAVNNFDEAKRAMHWAELRCLWSSQEIDTPRVNKLKFDTSFVGNTHNASSACNKRGNLPLLLGYLSRRYHFRGNGIMIGYSSLEANEILKEMDRLDEINVICISRSDLSEQNPMEMTGFELGISLNSVDFVVINQKQLNYRFNILRHLLSICSPLLKAGSGVLIVNNMLDPGYDVAVEGNDEDTDAWKLLADVRQHENFDAALANFDGGLLVCFVRSNPYVRSAKFVIEKPQSSLLTFLDRVIAILSFTELDSWLSKPLGTLTFVREYQSDPD